MPIVLKSLTLNLLEPPGPVQGLLYLFYRNITKPVQKLQEFRMECRQLDKVRINVVCIFISVFAGYHLQTISYINYSGARGGAVG